MAGIDGTMKSYLKKYSEELTIIDDGG